MAKGSEVVAAVHLSVLRGETPEESRQEAERVAGHPYQPRYIDGLRANALRLMRERLQEIDRPIMNFAALRQILELSARQRVPLEADAIRQLADMAGESRSEVAQAYQERHEAHMRAEARNVFAETWTWRLYDI
jgi:hypothetical protein